MQEIIKKKKKKKKKGRKQNFHQFKSGLKGWSVTEQRIDTQKRVGEDEVLATQSDLPKNKKHAHNGGIKMWVYCCSSCCSAHISLKLCISKHYICTHTQHTENLAC